MREETWVLEHYSEHVGDGENFWIIGVCDDEDDGLEDDGEESEAVRDSRWMLKRKQLRSKLYR